LATPLKREIEGQGRERKEWSGEGGKELGAGGCCLQLLGGIIGPVQMKLPSPSPAN